MMTFPDFFGIIHFRNLALRFKGCG